MLTIKRGDTALGMRTLNTESRKGEILAKSIARFGRTNYYKAMKIHSIRYINLRKNWHRKLMIQSALRNVPYPVFRSPGIIFDEKSDKCRNYIPLGLEEYLLNDPRSKGVIGCWIAHTVALEAVDDRQGMSVILEDDFICAPSFFDRAVEMLEKFDKDFDIIIFDPWGSGPLDTHKIDTNIFKPQNGFPYYIGTQCLFINNSKIPKILDVKLNSKIQDYDGFLFNTDKLECYLFYTRLSGTRHIGSDINKINNVGISGELRKWLRDKISPRL